MNKKAVSQVMTFIITATVLIIAAGAVFIPMTVKGGELGNDQLDRIACNTMDMDGDGDSNFQEESGTMTNRPCPCDDKNSDLGWGYKTKESTFTVKGITGPYELFDQKYEDELLERSWISAYDLEEMEMHLTMLKQRQESGSTFPVTVSMILSEDLQKYLRPNIDERLKSTPSTFFCPLSCAGQENDYSCCDLATFQKEWFEPGSDDFGLVGRCKTDPNVCADNVEQWCVDQQEAKKNGKIVV